MRHLKSWILITLCVSVSFVQSEKLPKKLPSTFQLWEENEFTRTKIASGLVRILSYNTWGLPISLSGYDQERRFALMGDSLSAKKADIITLQETFHPVLREKLLSNLRNDYYTFSDYRCGRSIIPGIEMDCYGGLMTFSIFPISEEHFFPFPTNDAYSIIEKTGSKGILVSYIKHGDKLITVINTHLYAGDNKSAEDIRLQQINFIHDMIKTGMVKHTDRIILVGDFNIQHPDVACSKVYDFITKNMNFMDSKPHLGKNDFTYSKTNNYCPSKTPSSKLDYVFIKSSDQGKIVSQSRIFDTKEPLSDHYGWQVNWNM